MAFARLSTVLPWNGGADASPFGYVAPTPDPSKPDPRARWEMEAYDLLPAEARAAVRESANDVALADKLFTIRQRGAPRAVLARLQSRGLLPYQVGEAGILAELVAQEIAPAAVLDKKAS